jgi:hypothetical protein
VNTRPPWKMSSGVIARLSDVTAGAVPERSERST